LTVSAPDFRGGWRGGEVDRKTALSSIFKIYKESLASLTRSKTKLFAMPYGFTKPVQHRISMFKSCEGWAAVCIRIYQEEVLVMFIEILFFLGPEEFIHHQP
jgi:hypothetical protein